MLGEILFIGFTTFIALSDNFRLNSLEYDSVLDNYLVWNQFIDEGVSRYYKPVRSTTYFSIGGIALVNENLAINGEVTLLSENRAPAILVPSTSTASIKFDYAVNEKEFWSLSVENILVISSKNIDYPCYDDFNRAYHCASQAPFSDASSYQTERRFEPKIKISKTWLF